MPDKMIDISVTNLARVHDRNRQLSEAVRELYACLDELETITERGVNALAFYKDLS